MALNRSRENNLCCRGKREEGLGGGGSPSCDRGIVPGIRKEHSRFASPLQADAADDRRRGVVSDHLCGQPDDGVGGREPAL